MHKMTDKAESFYTCHITLTSKYASLKGFSQILYYKRHFGFQKMLPVLVVSYTMRSDISCWFLTSHLLKLLMAVSLVAVGKYIIASSFFRYTLIWKLILSIIILSFYYYIQYIQPIELTL